ncbi:hypothetical protein BV25DRAFT_1957720, partial [Artomyces pyxidatus]
MVIDDRHDLGVDRWWGRRRRGCGEYGLKGRSGKCEKRRPEEGRENAVYVGNAHCLRVVCSGLLRRHREPHDSIPDSSDRTQNSDNNHDGSHQDDNAHDGNVRHPDDEQETEGDFEHNCNAEDDKDTADDEDDSGEEDEDDGGEEDGDDGNEDEEGYETFPVPMSMARPWHGVSMTWRGTSSMTTCMAGHFGSRSQRARSGNLRQGVGKQARPGQTRKGVQGFCRFADERLPPLRLREQRGQMQMRQ